ncbi:hypothetical protein TRAPUB_1270 [Trametes pubescens]|uniref:Uncharacterized protein n=1 Tax=Trametes pubescens TaxID=154538 RepID=A0A1M2VJX1_TRAPU|nr:hypothetical protein TRAPUB_1270 [Trametes pubescens]
MSSGKTAEDSVWKSREQAAEGQYARAKEQEQLQAIRDDLAKKEAAKSTESEDKNFEGGYGGQEDLEDRYATTYGMH